MGQGKGNRRTPPRKRPNIDHFAHQVHVTGTGPHANKKHKEELFRKMKHKKQELEEKLDQEENQKEEE
jgi:hypothetical protein